MTRLLISTFTRICAYRLLPLILFISLFYSCTTTKTITYFQGKGQVDTARYAALATITPTVGRIQPDDILAIIVSSLSEESNVLFNSFNRTDVTTTRFPGGISGGSQPLGYLVDPAGEVNIPLVGKVKLNGMTLEEAGLHVKDKLARYLKEPTVNVRQLNHKFTIIGDVSRPGVFNLLNDHTTLPDVIGMAGDLTVFGRRDNVMIIRTTNGQREIFKVDLTSRDVLNSPFYFIQNDDVIYVEARSGKITQTDRTIQLLPIVISAASALLIVVNILVR